MSSFRRRTSVAEDPSGNGAGIYVRFYDKENKSINGVGGWVVGPVKETDPKWRDYEEIFEVPALATGLDLQVLFRSANGEIRVDTITVVPVAMAKK